MWNTIVLYIRKVQLKGKLRRAELKSTRNELATKSSTDSKETKKIKKKIFRINIAIAISLIVPIVAFIVAMALIFQLMMFIGTVAGNNILGQRQERLEEDEKNKNWEWEVDGATNPSDILDISGGIYPKDPILKNRALMLKILDKSAQDAASANGIDFRGPDLLGVLINESGGGLFTYIDADKGTEWLTGLIYKNPVCGKGSGCKYVNNGYSHFIGGSVVNGKDTGDPYTQEINGDTDLYKKFGSNHGAGFFQHEVVYIKNRLGQNLFPIETELNISRSDLTFTSPNFFYIPDQTYMSAFYACNGTTGMTSYKELLNTQEYKDASSENQRFAKAVITAASYNGGTGIKNTIVESLQTLLTMAKSKNILLEDMLEPIKDNFYSTSTHTPIRTSDNVVYDYITKTYGVSIPSSYTATWYGIRSICWGKTVWNMMTEDVNAAEKEAGSNSSGIQQASGQWLEYVGSGKFKPTSSGKYYSQSIQATIFHQTSDYSSSTYREASWGRTKIGLKMLGPSGCGIYATAFAITNLTGTLVTPVDIVPFFSSLPATMGNMMEAARSYGLDAYQKNKKDVTSSGKVFEDWAISELKDGAQIINVWKTTSGKFPWYNGGGHYMVIRGYNVANNYLRVYTSVGVTGRGAFDKICEIELPASEVIKYLSPSVGENYNFIVIKPKGGVASSGTQQNTGANTTGSTGMIWPLPNGQYKITSLYGNRADPFTGKTKKHSGADIGVVTGTEIYAAKDGVVDTACTISNGEKCSWGIHVKLKHNDGTYTLYAHMSKINASANQQVKQGDVIGYVGSTGRSTGPHLHFELYQGSKRTDPLLHFLNLPLYMSSGGSKKMIADLYK